MNYAFYVTVSTMLLMVSNLSADTHYVSLGSTNSIPPYTNWGTAAKTIQDAVDAAQEDDEVMVMDGTYDTGGVATRVALLKRLTVQSVHGPQATVISGKHSVPCAYLTNGATLSGFTLTNAFSDPRYGGRSGAGVYCESASAVVSNCVLVNNYLSGWSGAGGGAYGGTLYDCTLANNNTSGFGGGAAYSTLYRCTLRTNSAQNGGGAYNCTLYNCTLIGNSAPYSDGKGGGAYESKLYNCTLRGNSASNGQGGGAYQSKLYNGALTGNRAWFGGGSYSSEHYNCTITGNLASGGGGGAEYGIFYNCILYFNTAAVDQNYYAITPNHCCTIPDPGYGVGNITNAPLFVSYDGGNLRLQSNSFCINAGNNSYVTNSVDLDGRPRIVGGTVDMGAYEFQGPGMGEFTGWLEQYGLATDGSADYAHADADGMNNFQEWVCATCPTNHQSALRMTSALPTSTNTIATWQSVAGVNYSLERSTSLGLPFTLLATNIVGRAGTTSYIDASGTGAGPFFYRVGVTAP